MGEDVRATFSTSLVMECGFLESRGCYDHDGKSYVLDYSFKPSLLPPVCGAAIKAHPAELQYFPDSESCTQMRSTVEGLGTYHFNGGDCVKVVENFEVDESRGIEGMEKTSTKITYYLSMDESYWRMTYVDSECTEYTDTPRGTDVDMTCAIFTGGCFDAPDGASVQFSPVPDKYLPPICRSEAPDDFWLVGIVNGSF